MKQWVDENIKFNNKMKNSLILSKGGKTKRSIPELLDDSNTSTQNYLCI